MKVFFSQRNMDSRYLQGAAEKVDP